MPPFVLYFARIGIALSVLLNVILGGKSNQTFSARNWDLKRRKKPNMVNCIDNVCVYVISPTINFFLTYVIRTDTKVRLTEHCMESWIYWRVRKDVAHDYKIGRFK